MKPDVAEARDEERLAGRRRRRRLLEVVADQQVGAEADAFPDRDEQEEVVRQHQPAHAEDEQAHHREEARVALVAVHVARRRRSRSTSR